MSKRLPKHRVNGFLARLTTLSCECGVAIARRDSAGNPVLVLMEDEDYAESYGLSDADYLIRADLSMAA